MLLYLPGVVTIALDESLCNGCTLCTQVCPRAVLTVDDRKARIVERDACIECGACATNCETGAITVRSGVGCAAAVITGLLRGTEPVCDCGEEPADRPSESEKKNE